MAPPPIYEAGRAGRFGGIVPGGARAAAAGHAGTGPVDRVPAALPAQAQVDVHVRVRARLSPRRVPVALPQLAQRHPRRPRRLARTAMSPGPVSPPFHFTFYFYLVVTLLDYLESLHSLS